MTEAPAQPRRLGDLLSQDFLTRLDALDVMSRRILQGKLQGERRSKQRGRSVEFADHRPYAVGDDLRLIDWNTFARLDQLFLKLFLEEQDLTVHILLDCSLSLSSGQGGKDAFARKLAAALGYVALVNNNRLTLSAFADGLAAQAENLRGRPSTRRLAEFLFSLPQGQASDFDKACRQFQAARSGSGVVIVISDFLFKNGYEDALTRLLSPAYDLYAIQVLSPQEIQPELTGDLRLVDVEDGEIAEITVTAPLMTHYRRMLAAYCDQLDRFCARRGAAYVRASSADSVETLVLTTLRKRGLLK
ncbi:MAG: hypothetical protein BWX88_04394 [Planctomycetes bacterium ADurb.Bin126]|nr:MAG: hypothetical protein BWX88_04394 [Planctomycetes bacterium ADurb.Bin126]HOD81992.1 DUF58 domain-containing protein [Phycisphaerae bacterium]HQL74260.1 DUF58 domain-containing protein [Phycisphaerae bacterium]